jgi:hypothetical protein
VIEKSCTIVHCRRGNREPRKTKCKAINLRGRLTPINETFIAPINETFIAPIEETIIASIKETIIAKGLLKVADVVSVNVQLWSTGGGTRLFRMVLRSIDRVGGPSVGLGCPVDWGW